MHLFAVSNWSRPALSPKLIKQRASIYRVVFMCLMTGIHQPPSAGPARIPCEIKADTSQFVAGAAEQLCVFSIFQGGTPTDPDSGLLVYSEAVRLRTAEGTLEHIIGTGTPVFGKSLTAQVFETTENVYVQLSIGDDGKPILPRRLVNSVPYALVADNSDSLGGRAARDYMLWEDYNALTTKARLSVPGTGTGSTIGGGSFNSASGDWSTVGGGYANSASGRVSTIAGGEGNQANGNYGVVGGGYYSTAGYLSSVGGGIQNQAYNYSVVAGGYRNTANGLSSFVGGGAQNYATGERTTVAGGWNNQTTATYSSILGGHQNRAWGEGATVGGGVENTVYRNYGTISGGHLNRVTESFGTVAGGSQNSASGYASFVGGGVGNDTNNTGAVVSGGQSNEAVAFYCTVSGGSFNSASGINSTVSGGRSNIASGAQSTVPGGRDNSATGSFSFAAGYRAKALHDGSFVWADSVEADFAVTEANTFNVRAGNGAKFYGTKAGGWGVLGHSSGVGGYGLYGISNNGAGAKGVVGHSSSGHAGYFYGNVHVTGDLTVAGAINPSSDRAIKANFSAVDPREILRRLLAVKIEKWTYREDAKKAAHIGAMAQDFSKAFGVGTDDKHIATIDADGVALAAIQGLHAELLERLEKQQRTIDKQQAMLADQQNIIQELKTRVDRIGAPAVE